MMKIDDFEICKTKVLVTKWNTNETEIPLKKKKQPNWIFAEFDFYDF